MIDRHFWLLLFWIIIGACLRFTNLGTLPPWTDESATIVFSLGNSFYNVPLNQFIGLQTLLEPFQLNADAKIADVVNLLLTESTHPPLYFVLTHLWLKLFPPVEGYVSIWAARSLSASIGVMTIPAIFYFAKFAFRSLVIAQIAAAMMAISPLGIFLAIQARHYTLVILLVIASLSCFIHAFRSIARGKLIPLWLVFVWIGINCIGVATHYFFVLTLAAMAIAFIPSVWQQFRHDKTILWQPQWRRIYLVAIGSFFGCLVWLPVLQTMENTSPTDWIYQSNPTQRWLEPIGRFLLWLMSMAILLPSSLYDFSLVIVIIAGLLTLIFWFWSLPHIISGLKLQQQIDRAEAISALKGYLFAAIALVFFFTYVMGMDLTLSGRFQFVYFPAVIILIAVGLNYEAQDSSKNKFISLQQNVHGYFWLNSVDRSRKRIVVIFLCVGLLGGVIANLNLGYLQNHRPDLMVDTIVKGTNAPLVIATTYRHHGQTGRMMGLAWGLKNLPSINSPQFFLATENLENSNYKNSVEILQQKLTEMERPLDFWAINFRPEIDLETQNCLLDSQYIGMAGQYQYKLYHCH